MLNQVILVGTVVETDQDLDGTMAKLVIDNSDKTDMDYIDVLFNKELASYITPGTLIGVKATLKCEYDGRYSSEWPGIMVVADKVTIIEEVVEEPKTDD